MSVVSNTLFRRSTAPWAAATALALMGAIATGLPGEAAAQSSTATPPVTAKSKPAAKPVAKAAAAKPAAAPVASKPKPKTTAAAKPKASAVEPAPAEAVAHLPLNAAQLAIANTVYVGAIPCELGQTVELQPMEGTAGFFKLKLGKASYTLAPEETTTGAVRLEDRPNGIVWLQLINKSMLMNHKLGRRMADECMSPAQQRVAQEMQRNPPPSLLDAPPKPAAGASAAPAAEGQQVAKP